MIYKLPHAFLQCAHSDEYAEKHIHRRDTRVYVSTKGINNWYNHEHNFYKQKDDADKLDYPDAQQIYSMQSYMHSTGKLVEY